MHATQILTNDMTDLFNVMLLKLLEMIWLDTHVIMHSVMNGPFLEMN